MPSYLHIIRNVIPLCCRGGILERVIIHSDANSFYASVECLFHPEIRDKPVAVVGDPEQRHGIILTKNQIDKKYGIVTGDIKS